MSDTISKRIDNVTLVTEEYAQPICPAPKSVKIELTSRCNFSCGFCAHRLKDPGDCEDMSWNFFTRIVKEMLEAGVEELGMFYIGESLMCRWLASGIDYAKRLGMPYVFLTTNGSMLDPAKAEDLMSCGLDSLKFSYNSADAMQFRTMTNMAMSMYERIKDNIKQARQIRDMRGYRTRLYASSILYERGQYEKMQEAVEEIKPYVDEHYWLPLYSFGSLASQREQELGYRPTAGNQGRVGALRDPLPCWAVFKEGHITAGGKLSACCFDAADRWIMADLNEVSFMDGWNSEKFQKLRQAHLKRDVTGTECEACAAY